MQAKSEVKSSTGFSEFVSPNPYNPSSFQVQPGQMISLRQVNPGAMISGDKKSPNPWSYSVYELNTPIGSSSRNYFEQWSEGDPPEVRSSYSRLEQRISSPLVVGDINGSSDQLLSAANEEAYNKFIEAARGQIDLSIDLFQLKQTTKMVNAIGRFRDAFERMPGKHRANWSTIPKELGGKWLEWTYGWSPMLSTIHEIIEESLNHHINNFVVVKGRRSLKESDSVPYVSSTPNGPIQHRIRVDSFAKVQYVCSLRVVENDISRFTSLNPASIAWELTPYSFVVDWFVDVGSYLRGLETATMYQDRFISGYKTTLRGWDSSTSASRFVVIDKDRGEYGNDAFSANAKFRALNRSVLTAFPFPNFPRLNLDLSSGRMRNAAALLTTFLKGR